MKLSSVFHRQNTSYREKVKAFSLSLMYNVSYGARTLSFSRNILTTMTVPITVIYKNLTGLED